MGDLDYLVRCLPYRPNHLRNIYTEEEYQISSFYYIKCGISHTCYNRIIILVFLIFLIKKIRIVLQKLYFCLNKWKIFLKIFFKLKKRRNKIMENKFHEKNIAWLGIKPKMSWFEAWCLSPLDHEISIILKINYQYIYIVKSSTKPLKVPKSATFFLDVLE